MTKGNASQSRVYIAQGEFAVSDIPDAIISTILGSCVATCLWDPMSKIGGMNHFLLPEGPATRSDVCSFGVNAIELLINGLIKAGADRQALCAKVFGGAEMYRGLTDAGNRNGAFVLDYLSREGIECSNKSLGGSQARRIEFTPYTGNVRQKLVPDTHISEPAPVLKVDKRNELELF